MVVVPYIEGLSEKLSRVYRKHNISCAMKPHTTIRSLLVHPKDKIEKGKTCGVVYQIPCSNCNKVYIGETSRQLDTRCKEHKDDVQKHTQGVSTRSQRKTSATVLHTSALTDHAAATSHVIDWTNIDIKAKEDNLMKRIIKEAICIRKTKNNMNRDAGRHTLSHVYDSLLARRPRGGGQ